MVRSRSETNLNRIFVDLCTSPDQRSTHNQQRRFHPPLPNLQTIKSNSCSNLNELVESSISNEQEDVNRVQTPDDTTVPLIPMESTGFTVQTTTLTTHQSLKLF